MGKKIVITGNQGYIGSVLGGKLEKKGYEVHGWDVGIFKDANFIARPKVSYQKYLDVRDVKASDLAGVYGVMHLAGLSNDPLGELDKSLTEDINYQASVRLAILAKEAGVARFLFSSSCSSYGASGDQLVNEKARLDPKTAYAISKVKVEEDVKGMADEKFYPVFLRNATVFGISPRLRLDLVVQNLAMTGYLSGVIDVLSDGTPWRPLVHVDDVADAFIFLLEAPEQQVRGQAFNIGREDNNVQVREIAEIVSSVLPSTAVKIHSKSSPDERTYRVAFSKIEALGWRAKHTLESGISDLCKIFNEQGFDEREAQLDVYHTLKRYQNLMAEGVLDKELRVLTGEAVEI